MIACSQSPSAYPIAVLALLGSALMACAHQPGKPATTTTAPQTSGPATNVEPSVARYSRYTLIEMSPDAAQSDLLQQIIDVHVPATASSSVGDTLRYVLLHSGYRLCDNSGIRDFDGFPLPAAHMHLGPLTLASALQLLVGPAWILEIDESERRVCFS